MSNYVRIRNRAHLGALVLAAGTRSAVARSAGISGGRLTQILNGRPGRPNRVTSELAGKLATALGVRPGDIFIEEPDQLVLFPRHTLLQTGTGAA